MNFTFFNENPSVPQAVYSPPSCPRQKKRYGFFSFLWDVFMTFLTCGIWLIWIFVREMRKH